MKSVSWSWPCLHLLLHSILSSLLPRLDLSSCWCSDASLFPFITSPLSSIFHCRWSTLQQHQDNVKLKINYLWTIYHRLLSEHGIHICTFTFPVPTNVSALSLMLPTSGRTFLRAVYQFISKKPCWASHVAE